MKKSIIAVILFSMLAAAPVVYAELKDKICDGVDVDFIKKHVPVKMDLEIMSQRNVKGLCETIVKTDTNTVPLYVNKEEGWVFAGEMFQNGEGITQEVLAKAEEKQVEEAKKLFSSIRPLADKSASISYVPAGGNPKHTVYMFASPRCPHCTTAAKNIRFVLDKTNTQLKMVFFASGPARDDAITATCKGVDLEGYNKGDWKTKTGEKTMACATGAEKVDTGTMIARQLKITGVPTFFLEDGRQVQGANLPELERLLKG